MLGTSQTLIRKEVRYYDGKQEKAYSGEILCDRQGKGTDGTEDGPAQDNANRRLAQQACYRRMFQSIGRYPSKKLMKSGCSQEKYWVTNISLQSPPILSKDNLQLSDFQCGQFHQSQTLSQDTPSQKSSVQRTQLVCHHPDRNKSKCYIIQPYLCYFT